MILPQLGTIYQQIPYQESSLSDTFRILTWNIHRGYKLHKIISYLKTVSPDIICLQESDLGNNRTHKLDITKEIGDTLEMNFVMTPDHEELYSWKRNLSKQAGQGGGIIGSAILSKSPMQETKVITLPTPYTFHSKFLPSRSSLRQWIAPVHGNCNAIGTTFTTNVGKKLRIYTTHLEISRASMQTRIEQFKTIASEAATYDKAIITGDFNTAAHGAFGIYNFLENKDAFTKKNIFTPEAVYWTKAVLPATLFSDPFNPKTDWTLELPPIYHAKLDWILQKGCSIQKHFIGDVNYSDHKPLICDVLI